MPRAFRASAVRRSIALLLTAVFLAAGTTLPGPDALFHHGGGAAGAEHHPHVEPAGGCTSHADGCTLGRVATGAGAVLVHTPAVAPAPAGRAASRSAGRPAASSRLCDLLPSPRAPPPPIA